VINQTGFPDYMLIVWDYVCVSATPGFGDASLCCTACSLPMMSIQ